MSKATKLVELMPRAKAKPKSFVAIGCSIYAGLFTLGVKRAGFKVLAHLEQDAYGTDTAILNHPELDIYVGRDAWPEQFEPRPDLVFCNPPCAVWSPVSSTSISTTAKALKHWRDDPRLQHAYDALETVSRYEPTIWIWESVPQALTRGHSLMEEMAQRGRELGYACTILHFDASTLGVPQRRPRIFVVLHKVAFDPEVVDHDTTLTVKEAWKNLPKTNREVEKTREQDLRLLPHTKPGMALRRAFDSTFGEEGGRNERGQMIGRPSIPEKRLRIDGLGIPMMAKAWHPTQSRRITVGEALRLCQLPDDWQFGASCKTPTARKELLQRAVMPTVGEWVARAAFKALRRAEPVDPTQSALVRDLRAREEVIYRLDAGAETTRGALEAAPARVAAPKAEKRLLARSQKVERTPRAPPTETAIEKARRVCANTTSGSGARIRALILKGGMTDDAIVASILKEFDGHKTTRSDVSWNRGMLRKAGLLKEAR